jgi:hypothetical protein
VRLGILVCGCALASPVTVAVAADGPAPPPGASQLIWRPAIILSDMGFDTNILTSSANQIRDTTALLTLQVEPSARLGSLTVGGRASGRASYFEHSVYERSIDTDDAVAAAVTGRRASVFGEGNYARTRDRFDPEIYVRTQRTEGALRGGGALRITGKTELRGSVGESRSNYDMAQVFSPLGLRLNRRVATASTSLRTAVTRLTSVAVVADLERERFDADPEPRGRDLRIMGGVELKSTALLSGSAYAGYRKLGGLSTSERDAGTIVGAIDLRLRTGESLQWNIVLARELSRSRLIQAPQLTTRRAGLSVTRRITPRWEFIVGGSRQWLDYSGGSGPVAVSQATDLSFSLDETARYTAETIYRLGRSVRVSGSFRYDRLHVVGAPADYERLRAVSAIEYRF